jgi:hypothetical protein
MYNHHQEPNNNIPINSLFMSNQPTNNHKLIQINNQTSTSTQDSALALLLPLLVLLSSLLFLLLLFLIFLIVLRRRRSHHHPSSTRRHLLRLGDNDGPLDLSIPEEPEIEGGIEGLERRWLESCSQATRNGYLRAKSMSSNTQAERQRSFLSPKWKD